MAKQCRNSKPRPSSRDSVICWLCNCSQTPPQTWCKLGRHLFFDPWFISFISLLVSHYNTINHTTVGLYLRKWAVETKWSSFSSPLLQSIDSALECSQPYSWVHKHLDTEQSLSAFPFFWLSVLNSLIHHILFAWA